MELKIKFLKWSAGLPVAMLNKETAKEIGVHAKDRVCINTIPKSSKQISIIVDIVEDLVKEKEIAVSSEVKEIMNINSGKMVDVNLTETPKSLVFIKKKLDKKILSEEEIKEIIKDIVNDSLSEPEIALFVSAMYEQGMNFKETIFLIKAILNSGETLKLNNKYIVDKHSIGGIPGNRTTPIVVSICASTGLIMPKNSSRAITSAAGTADVIETIAKVDFSSNELEKILKKTNACLVWGGSWKMVPADSKIINVERVLNIDPEAQLLASIMSKKLAVNSKYILIDIPYGKHAKVCKKKALILKKKFEKIGKYFKKDLKCVLTNGSQPIGNGIGPALELIDTIKVLDPNQKGPEDLEKKSLYLSGLIFEMTGKSKRGEGVNLAKEILTSGKAFEKFKEIIKAQDGSIKKLKKMKFKIDVFSKKSGKIYKIHNKKINSLARIAGCPVDKYSGLYLYYHLGDKVKKGQKIITIYSESRLRLKEAIKFYNSRNPIKIR